MIGRGERYDGLESNRREERMRFFPTDLGSRFSTLLLLLGSLLQLDWRVSLKVKFANLK